ncbi:uncharacterized protein B0H64DRAFT_215113 [Chaetomium fimeti]|uniref:Uncharacterized protein n=1 Tax=Chaetomium fimeti TaxID=1854472 RepID=A0AAE0HBP9_9PEZI|nr:hypothetical protein B0H64DRAFT_215113 [Chaetomium fimeti]
MAASIMRAVAQLRVGHARLPLQISTPSPISRRCYSSFLRPLTLTYNNNTGTTTKRPTLPHRNLPFQHQPHHRPFSLQPLIDTATTASHTLLSASQTLLTTIHSTTGTPWYVSIPLFALTLGLLTRVPTTIYSRRVLARRVRLFPLGMASVARAHADVAAAARGGGSRPRGAQLQEMVKVAVQREGKLRARRWEVQGWKDWAPALMVFPVWVVGIEGLRRMCGGPKGVLGALIYGPDAGKAVGEGAAAGGVAGQVPVPGATATAPVVGVDVVSPATGQEGILGALPTYVAEPSMATEGCLWFPDLTVADPLHVLPFVLSAMLLLNVVPRTQMAWRQLLGLETPPETWTGNTKWRLRMQRALFVVALAIGPLTINLPAALHLYWITSATLTKLYTTVISKLMPLPQNVRPATREGMPLVMPTRDDKTKPDEKR